MNWTQYLGFNMGEGNIEPVLSKVQAIESIPTPACQKEVQRFLGMVGYYWAFIPQFSEVAASLTDCLKGGKEEEMGMDSLLPTSFQEIEDSTMQGPGVTYP